MENGEQCAAKDGTQWLLLWLASKWEYKQSVKQHIHFIYIVMHRCYVNRYSSRKLWSW